VQRRGCRARNLHPESVHKGAYTTNVRMILIESEKAVMNSPAVIIKKKAGFSGNSKTRVAGEHGVGVRVVSSQTVSHLRASDEQEQASSTFKKIHKSIAFTSGFEALIGIFSRRASKNRECTLHSNQCGGNSYIVKVSNRRRPLHQLVRPYHALKLQDAKRKKFRKRKEHQYEANGLCKRRRSGLRGSVADSKWFMKELENILHERCGIVMVD
jgi:hypothetical protein